jgi:peptidoglycan/LPS O-acetylase OafA/YrhL
MPPNAEIIGLKRDPAMTTPLPATADARHPRATARHFEVLDGLRGVAAILVVIGHATAMINGATLVGMKLVAVWFFFMLSGFVIASAYEDRLNAGMSLQRYALGRVIRLHPLLVLGAVMGAVWFGPIEHTMSLNLRNISAVMAAMAGVPSIKVTFNWSRFPLAPPEWSLFFELTMYVAFALALRRMGTRTLIAVGASCFLAFAITEYHWETAFIPMKAQTPGVVASFVIGILLHRWNARGALPRWRAPFWVPSLMLVILAVTPVRFAYAAAPFSVMIALPLILIMGIAAGTGQRTAFQHWLGEISYPLYITHFTILSAFAAAHWALPPLLTVLACITAIAVAWTALVVYDQPLRRWLTKRFQTR